MISKLRRPYDNESDECARLTYISGPDLYSYIFVAGEAEIRELLRLFYSKPGNMHSKELIVVEEENNRIRGLVIAFPASDTTKLAMQMLQYIKGMIRINGVLNFLRMMFRLILLNNYYPGTVKDELFVANLAVFAKHRGKAIATNLLAEAEAMAKENGLNKLSLYMEIDNDHARKVYEHLGWHEVKKVVLPKKYHKHNLFGFAKMVKVIGEN